MLRIIACIPLMLLPTMAVAEQKVLTVRIATEGAYPPWNFVEGNGKVGGFEVAVGNELCARASLNCEWLVSDWDTLIPDLQAKEFDAIMAAMGITDEREAAIDFTEIYALQGSSRYLAVANATFNFDDLQGARIGAQTATMQHVYLETNHAPANAVHGYKTIEAAVADLLAGNLDLVMIGTRHAEEFATSSGALAVTGPVLRIGRGVGIGLRAEDNELELRFNAAIVDMKRDGSLDALILQWFHDPNYLFKNSN